MAASSARTSGPTYSTTAVVITMGAIFFLVVFRIVNLSLPDFPNPLNQGQHHAAADHQGNQGEDRQHEGRGRFLDAQGGEPENQPRDAPHQKQHQHGDGHRGHIADADVLPLLILEGGAALLHGFHLL